MDAIVSGRQNKFSNWRINPRYSKSSVDGGGGVREVGRTKL